MEKADPIKSIVVVASTLAGALLLRSIAGAGIGLMASGVLCILADAAFELRGVERGAGRRPRRRRVMRVVVLAVVLLLPGGMWSWDASAEQRGRLMARWDLAQGHLCVKRAGYGYATRSDYREEEAFLGDTYGVHLDAVAGCVLSPSLEAYIRGYNSVSIVALSAKFGRDISEEYRRGRSEER